MASDDTERWCPVHGLHDDWTRNAPLCNRQREDCYGHCDFAPIATDVVATIEQRGYERGLADGAARERANHGRDCWPESDDCSPFWVLFADRERPTLISSIESHCWRLDGLAPPRWWVKCFPTDTNGPDPLAEHDARVRAEARRDALREAANLRDFQQEMSGKSPSPDPCVSEWLRELAEDEDEALVRLQAPKYLEGEDEQ